jgi:hypothetical protein
MSESAARLALDPERLARLPAPLILMRGTRILAVGLAARAHLPHLLADGGTALPAPAAGWLHGLAAAGRAVLAPERGAAGPGLAAHALASDEIDGGNVGGGRFGGNGIGGNGIGGEPICLAHLSVERPATAGRLDPKLAALLDNARFIAMGELVDALEHRLNQPRAALRNRMAAIDAVLTRDPARARALLTEAYGDMQTLLGALAAFREELHARIDGDTTAAEPGAGSAGDSAGDSAGGGAPTAEETRA